MNIMLVDRKLAKKVIIIYADLKCHKKMRQSHNKEDV